MAEPLIAIERVTKVYSTGSVATYALRGVTMSVQAGEFAAIMGPSGSGKSTLLHILGLLDRPTSGTYKFHGKVVATYSDNELASLRNKEIGFVFQSFNLLPHLTVLENVMLPLYYSTVRPKDYRARAQAALEAVGLPTQLFSKESFLLSGGEKQRVAIARALVNSPQLILADEPTGNLDTASGKVVMETLSRLHKHEGRTIILVTHDPAIANYAQRTIHIRDGKVVKSNAPSL
ncbi:ABC transporter ATP-binding protein [Candidatus Parcubacteria bacterium]|nr:MAG: ABC transporter ATP-binding protein [Candidatus Parcubacteria bacterium]